MSERDLDILDRLETLSRYEGPWRLMRKEAELLRARLDELRRREARFDDFLVVALVGGSGVGKSTLLNAIAGDQLAETSEFRPCTSIPAVYHPPGAEFRVDGWRHVPGSALERLIIIDTPDSDTVVREHRDIVSRALGLCDLIVICGSGEKYLDEATWSLLRPLQRERTMVCVETKAHGEAQSIRDHWLKRLGEQGFEVAGYFRLNARRTLDRRIRGESQGDGEFDWGRFENYLYNELTRERIQRIKRSNAAGLLAKALSTLHDRLMPSAAGLETLDRHFEQAEQELAGVACQTLEARLFGEAHLWAFAVGRELSMRAKGFTGTVYRLIEGVRSFPARLSGWLPWVGSGGGAGREAAGVLADRGRLSEEFNVALGALHRAYDAQHSTMALALTQAGFDSPESEAGWEAYSVELRGRVDDVLRGPARERIVAGARRLTSWPVAMLADLPPLAFAAITAYKVVAAYFVTTVLLPVAWFLHAATVLGIILAVEVVVVSLAGRGIAWRARRGAARDLRIALGLGGLAFTKEREALAEARRILMTVERLHTDFRHTMQPAKTPRN